MADGKPKSTTPEQDAELDAAFEKARAAMAQIEDCSVARARGCGSC